MEFIDICEVIFSKYSTCFRITNWWLLPELANPKFKIRFEGSRAYFYGGCSGKVIVEGDPEKFEELVQRNLNFVE
jgi:hypothetical protein